MPIKFLFIKLYFSFLSLSLAFGSSFDDIECILTPLFSSAGKNTEIALHVKKTHQNLANEQTMLYEGIQAETALIEDVTSSSKTTKSGSSSKKTKSNKSVNLDLSSTNFAMSNLCVITNSDQIIDVPLTNHSDQLVYDSCVNGTHNIIPYLDDCQNQWERYLGTEALILNENTIKVKQNIIEAKDKITDFFGDLCKACDEQASKQAIETLENLKDKIESYHGFIRTWTMYGWHSEQRIIHDLDSDRLENELISIHEKNNGIKMIIACVHTRLAPCIAKIDAPDKPKGKSSDHTCDCYNTLRNWPSRWTFKNKRPDLGGLPLVMTVSYVDYSSQTKEAEYSRPDRATPNFFLQQIIPTEDKDILHKGKKWLNSELSFSWHYMNMYKTPLQLISAYERELVLIMQPLINSYNVRYEGETSLTMDYSELRLQRYQTTDRVRLLNIMHLSGIQAINFCLVGTEPLDPIHLLFSAEDTDWMLLLKFHVIAALRI